MNEGLISLNATFFYTHSFNVYTIKKVLKSFRSDRNALSGRWASRGNFVWLPKRVLENTFSIKGNAVLK